jgi:hypothetical protein
MTVIAYLIASIAYFLLTLILPGIVMFITVIVAGKIFRLKNVLYTPLTQGFGFGLGCGFNWGSSI